MTLKLKNADVAGFNETAAPALPKYVSGLLNLANQTCQATRPSRVGQMTELVAHYIATAETPSIEGWREHYTSAFPGRYEAASGAVYAHIEVLREAMAAITPEMVEAWMADLLFHKTFNGLHVQPAILSAVAAQVGKDWRSATKEEEARGIDGFIGGRPVSVKPTSYRHMDTLSESIEVPIIFYEKKKSDLVIDFDEAAVR